MSTSFDASRPNAARMYDYWLGGKDNYEADRQAADAVRRLRPNVAQQALDNKKFQTRAITYVAGQGVRQFLDVGSGLPTSPARGDGAPPLWRATHEAAQKVVPDAVDMRDPRAILHDAEIRAAGFDLAAPACVLLACILHFVDAALAKGIVTAFSRALAPGSFLVISVRFARGQAGHDFASTYNAQDGPRIYAHSWEEITALFDDLDLVPPGITNTSTWRPGSPRTTRTDDSSMIVGGVGRRS
jgi:hypothetical protein